MITSTSAGELLDILEVESKAIVLLYTDDELGAEALSVATGLGSQRVPIYAVRIEGVNDAKLLQVIKLPQYRFYRNGSEVEAFVGNIPTEDLLAAIGDF